MILPGSYLFSVLLLVLSLVCLGSWANTAKASGKTWRFELYYFDFAIGAFIASLIAALTLGSLGWDGFAFLDDIVLAGKRQDAFTLGAGVIFNLGNMLIVAGLSVGGMVLAFPLGFGLSLLSGAIWATFLGPAGNTGLRLGGGAAVLAAGIISVVAYRSAALANLVEVVKTGKTRSTRKTVSMKPVILVVIGGLIVGSFAPLLEAGQDADIGLGPYSAGFMFSIGILFSTVVFNLFFMNLPVAGEPVDMLDYFKGRAGAHVRGLVGGLIWYVGMLSVFICERVKGAAAASPALVFGLSNASIIVAVLCGVALWKELSSPDTKVNFLVVVMLVLLAFGIGIMAFGQVAPER